MKMISWNVRGLGGKVKKKSNPISDKFGETGLPVYSGDKEGDY